MPKPVPARPPCYHLSVREAPPACEPEPLRRTRPGALPSPFWGPVTHLCCGLLGAGTWGWSWTNRSGSPAQTARPSWLGQQRHPCGQGCPCVGILASVLGPQGLGQRKTLRNGAAEPRAKVGLPRRGLEAEAAGHTDHRDRSWAERLPGWGLHSWEKAKDRLKRLSKMSGKVQHMSHGAHLLGNTVCHSNP
uniref:Uncharacterized protein n=1 Tax=Molossus molossus TaxID=27622 RepID=A0A7J8JX74_MOLMO|nr:hypothetical protein HJG59_008091 [Molossus molossus]